MVLREDRKLIESPALLADVGVVSDIVSLEVGDLPPREQWLAVSQAVVL